MNISNLRSPRNTIGGLMYFGRMLDKIRLHTQGKLPADYLANLGQGFDAVCCEYLKVRYSALVEQTKQGGTDDELLQWCYRNGRKLSEDEITILNDYLSKRGWRDARSARVAELKQQNGISQRADVQTFFDLIDMDEGREADIPR